MTVEHEDQGLDSAHFGLEVDTELGLALMAGEAHFFALLQAQNPELTLPEGRQERQALGREMAAAGTLGTLEMMWQELDALRWQLAGEGAEMVPHLLRRLGRAHAREDLESVAWLGLYKAACQWDPERGLRFTTLARWTVRSELNQALERHGRLVRVPGTAHLRLRKLQREMQQASLAKAAARLEMSTDRAAKLLAQAGGKGVSFDAQDADGLSLTETLPAQSVDPVERLDRVSHQAHLLKALEGLSERDRRVIQAYYGMEQAPKSFRQIGEQMGISGERARQLCRRATLRIRAALP